MAEVLLLLVIILKQEVQEAEALVELQMVQQELLIQVAVVVGQLMALQVRAVLELLLFATHLQLLNLLVVLSQHLVGIKFTPLHHQAH